MGTSIVVLTYNRLETLKRCLTSIHDNTTKNYEVLVVNNASTDGTKEYLESLNMFKNFRAINMDSNMGVVARNRGFEVAKGEFIAQVDDDVLVLKGWEDEVLQYFKDPKVGAVGPEGSLWVEWANHFNHNTKPGDSVDFLTGQVWVFRNEGWRYDEKFGKFWHEESDLQMQMKYKSKYVFKQCSRGMYHHLEQRGPHVDWDLHNRNFQRFIDKWKDKEADLNLEGKRKKRILFVSHGFPSYLSDVLFHGLTVEGHTVVEYPQSNHYYGDYQGNGHNDFLNQCCFKFRRPVWKEQEIFEHPFDAVIITSPRPETPELLQDLTKRYLGKVPFAFVDGEDDTKIRDIKCNIYFKREKLLNYCYCFNVRPLPFAIIERGESEHKTDIYQACFICAGHEPTSIRSRIFSVLKPYLNIYSNNVEAQKCWISYADYATALRSSAIGISASGVGFDTYRYWEIPFFGGMLFSEYPTIEIPNNFTDGENAIFFRSDLVDFQSKLDLLLGKTHLVKDIAIKGREFLLKNHTSVNRARTVLKELGL